MRLRRKQHATIGDMERRFAEPIDFRKIGLQPRLSLALHRLGSARRALDVAVTLLSEFLIYPEPDTALVENNQRRAIPLVRGFDGVADIRQFEMETLDVQEINRVTPPSAFGARPHVVQTLALPEVVAPMSQEWRRRSNFGGFAGS